MQETEFDAIVDTNLKSAFFLTVALAPAVVDRGAGKVVNITTMARAHRDARRRRLGASKAALSLLTKSWAAEYRPRGVNGGDGRGVRLR